MADDKLFSYLPDEYTFERMKNDEDPGFENYEEFYDYNKSIIINLSKKEKDWLIFMCNKMKKNVLKLVDEESCVEFYAYCFYYNKKKELCIMNPR